MRTASFSTSTLITGSLFLLIFLFSRCEKEHIEEPPVFFQEDVFPLIVSNCTGSECHNSVDQANDYDFTTYEGILEAVNPGDYKGSSLYKSLVKPFGYMPQDADRLSDEEISTIARWIEDGAENNSGGSGCDTTNVTFSETVMPLLQAWCLSCHAGNFPSGDFKLETHSQVLVKVNDGTLLGAIRHDPGFTPMPDGGGKLPQCDIEKIEKWVADGAPNN